MTVSGSGTSYTITLAQPINEPDRVTITIAGPTLATYTRRLDVLPGDFNDDGVVNGADLVGVHNEWLGINGAVPTIFGDINGDGVVNVTDYNDVREEIGAVLPSAERCTERRGPASQGGPASVQIGTVSPSAADRSDRRDPDEPGQSGDPADRHESPIAGHGGDRGARPRPRAEIQLSRRGSRLGTLTRGKMIHQRLIERTY